MVLTHVEEKHILTDNQSGEVVREAKKERLRTDDSKETNYRIGVSTGTRVLVGDYPDQDLLSNLLRSTRSNRNWNARIQRKESLDKLLWLVDPDGLDHHGVINQSQSLIKPKAVNHAACQIKVQLSTCSGNWWSSREIVLSCPKM